MIHLPFGVEAAGFAVGILAAAALGCAWRSTGRLVASGPKAAAGAAGLIGVALLVFGCRLALGEGRVSWAPYLDQWHAELGGVLLPLAHGTLSVRDFAAGNNEHRVVLTRILAVAVTLIDGAWDNRALVVLNYLLEALTVAWVSALSWKFLGWVKGSAVAAAAILPSMLLCTWEVLVSSNQSQFVFMAAGSVFALSLVQGYSVRSAGSWGALAFSVLMLGSMASGFLTAVALLATGIFMGVARRKVSVSLFGFAALCAAVGAVGWISRVPNPALQSIYAHSFRDWWVAFLSYGAWPFPASIAGTLALWIPWLLFVTSSLKKGTTHPLAPFAFGLGLWVLMQCAALAWTRAGLSGLVSSRYTEFVGWGVVANAVSFAILLGVPNPGRGRMSAALIGAAWLAAVCVTEARSSRAAYRPYLDQFVQQSLEYEHRLAAFEKSGNASLFRGVDFPHIPYYEPELILRIMEDAQVRPLLPVPLQREAAHDPVSAIQEGPLARFAIWAMHRGRWIGAAGVGLLALAAGLMGSRVARGPDTQRSSQA